MTDMDKDSELYLKIGCIVLAAGKSSRFGSNKLLADLYGKTVLERTLEAIPAESFEKVNIVTSSEEVYKRALDYAASKMPEKGTGAMEEAGTTSGYGRSVRGRFGCIRYPGGELSESIKQGLKHIGNLDGYLFVNADQPLLHPESFIKMLERFEENPYAIYRLSEGGRPASPVLFPREAYMELMGLSGDNGGKTVIYSGKYDIIQVEAFEPFETIDVDTVELLAKAGEILASRGENMPEGNKRSRISSFTKIHIYKIKRKAGAIKA